MTNLDTEALAALLDRQAIIEVLQRYILGMADRNHQLVLSCFTEDAQVDYEFIKLRSRAELARFMEDRRSSAGKNLYGLERVTYGAQQLPNIWVTLRGDEADVRSEGGSTYAGWRGEEKIVVMRSLTYHDLMRRVEGAWLIARRDHRPGWRVELPAVDVPAELAR
jgi:hypothetical protein